MLARAQFTDVSSPNPDRSAWQWPERLLPIVDPGSGFWCIDCSREEGPIVEWDPDEGDGRGRDGGCSRSFRTISPSLGEWLSDWLDAPSPRDEPAAMMEKMMNEVPEVTRQYWASMTPEQRAEYGHTAALETTHGLGEEGRCKAAPLAGIAWSGWQGIRVLERRPAAPIPSGRIWPGTER